VDWVQVGLVVGNFGAMAALVKVYASKVDKHAELVPAMAESLKTVAKALETTGQSIQELYNSRNSHALDIERLKMTHKLRGCELPVKEHDDET